MSTTGTAVADIGAFLADHESRSTLRFITCGSVDDGKSTLIGRLLYEADLVLDDQLATLEVDSRKVGTRGADLDFALLVDGLQAEREQGITIDVAYRFFTTARRQFIVADTPGHVQYTRNMATGASTADLAVILVDATRGVLEQTRRHTHLVALMGIDQVILAVNKLDLVGYSRDRFDAVVADYAVLADEVGIDRVTAVPLCAVNGDNLTGPSPNTAWYSGPSLLGALEDAPARGRDAEGPLRFAVQWVNRPDSSFRGFSGEVLAGTIAPGDDVVVLPSGARSVVDRIVTAEGDLDRATAGQAVTFTLSDEVDVSRGDVIADPAEPPIVADRFGAQLVWMAETPLVPGRRYRAKIGTATVGATVGPSLRAVDIASGIAAPVASLGLNDIGTVAVTLDAPIVIDRYARDRTLGGLILIDRLTNDTVAAGMIDDTSGTVSDLHWQDLSVDRTARRGLMGHGSAVVWLTGVSGAGKSTIADAVERKLHARGVHTFLLDGDNLRHGLCRDLGFSEADRSENIRRAGSVAKLLHEAGLVVIAAFISPYEAERRAVREQFSVGEFVEVFVDTPIAVAADRDPKGLYAKAERGELVNFTCIDAPYEAPDDAEVRIDTTVTSVEHAANDIIARLVENGIIGG
ncbi:MAG: adenylyl-sulfate kinase [Actinobacteria bacterium]|nr:adenylyl-sulfate kinase [Actinomycetota bacterium]